MRAVKLAVCALLFAPLKGGTAPDLVQAVRGNDVAGMRQMLAKGADPNLAADRGTTPLMYAAGFGTVDMMKILLDAGAAVNAKNAFNATALMWGISDLDKVKLLVDKGIDVNAKSKSGRTGLLLAAMNGGSEPVVKLLLSKGADPKAKDDGGTTLLLAAAASNNSRVARLALELGSDVNARDPLGLSPAMYAAQNGDAALLKMLLARGADANAVSSPPFIQVKNGTVRLGNFTALMFAAAGRDPEIVGILLDAGCKVDAKDARSMTALHFAVSSESQKPEIVRMLLAHGANPEAKTETGETARDWVLKFGRPEVLGLFQPAQAVLAAKLVPVEAAAAKDSVIRAAAEKSVALLQKTTTSFFREGGCASCHAQNITAMAVDVARRQGLKVDDAAANEQYAIVKSQWLKAMDSLILRQDPPGGFDTIDYSLFGLAASGHRSDIMTDALVHNVAAQQLENGGWRIGGTARTPIHESDFTRTAMSMRVLQLFGPDGLKEDYSRRIARAADWLLHTQPAWIEERDMQLLGLKWAGVSADAIQSRARELLALQRADGGWSQNPHLGSDAYATGQALYALNQAIGLDAGDPVYRGGLAYLLQSQQADGSWHVASRAVKFQPYFQSGFPYDHDQWISAQATAWASMALSVAVPPAQRVAVNTR